jgi:protein SEY1
MHTPYLWCWLQVLRPDLFEEEVVKLRGRFTDRSREDYVFKPAYHKRIPADGVAHYMEGIWEQVRALFNQLLRLYSPVG